jgi:preprotein translocase subunit SecE
MPRISIRGISYVGKRIKVRNTKTIAFILLALSWLMAVALRGLAIPVMAKFEMGDPVIGFISASAMAAIALGVGTYIALMRNTRVVQFADEVIDELNKVTWPEKDETISSTIVVVGVTLFIAAALGLYDYVWAEVTQLVLYTAG